MVLAHGQCRVKFPHERKRRGPSIPEHVPEFDFRRIALQHDRLFNRDRTDGRDVPEVYTDFVAAVEWLGVPLSRPQLSMVGIRLAVDQRNLVVRKELVPAATPDIVIARVHGQPRRLRAWIVPKEIGIGRLVGDLPNFGAGLGQDDDTQRVILQDHGAKAVQAPVRADTQVHGRRI